MYKTRKLEKTILKYLSKREILAIIGPRQSGKTTLLQKIQSELPNSIFISFEDRDDLELFETDPKGFAEKYFGYRYIFIDEFQYSKSGGKNLKLLYDLYPKNKVILSGSSAIDLTINTIKYLVGRIFVFNLYNLNFEEYLTFTDNPLLKVYQEYKKGFNLKNVKINLPKVSPTLNKQFSTVFEEFVIWGGYPRVVLSKSKEEKTLVLKNIYNTYFLRDIRDSLGLIDDFKLSALIRAISLQIGQLVEYNDLGQVSGYDYITLKKYLNVLEKTFIAKPIKPYFTNKRTELVKNPKLYFFDTGLRNFIVNDFRKLNERTDSGFLLENFLENQLQKSEIETKYWRTKSQAEVDFILKVKSQLVPLECKLSLKKPQVTRSFASYISEYRPVIGIITCNMVPETINRDSSKIYFIPPWLI